MSSGNSAKRPIRHLVLRLGSHIVPVDEAINEHKLIISIRGNVWLAKVGKAIGRHVVEAMREQISRGQDTFVFIATGHRAHGFKIYRCKLVCIRFTPEKSMMPEIPGYYHYSGVMKTAGAWLRLSSIEEDMDALSRLRVVSSHMPLVESMSTSSSSTFFVQEEILAEAC